MATAFTELLDIDFPVVQAPIGQSVGTIGDALPAAEIVRAIMDDAQTALGSAARALAP